MRRRHCAFAALALLVLSTNTSASSASSASAPGQNAPTNSTSPSISGNAVVGTMLAGNPGVWNGPSPTYSYQWARCGASGAPCSTLASATAQSYSPTSADFGDTLRVTVTASNKNGTT